jgi:hypothetical protein
MAADFVFFIEPREGRRRYPFPRCTGRQDLASHNSKGLEHPTGDGVTTHLSKQDRLDRLLHHE